MSRLVCLLVAVWTEIARNWDLFIYIKKAGTLFWNKTEYSSYWENDVTQLKCAPSLIIFRRFDHVLLVFHTWQPIKVPTTSCEIYRHEIFVTSLHRKTLVFDWLRNEKPTKICQKIMKILSSLSPSNSKWSWLHEPKFHLLKRSYRGAKEYKPQLLNLVRLQQSLPFKFRVTE